MRAPLWTMGVFAEVLQEEVLASGTSPETQDYCQRIMTGTSRLGRRIRDALNYSQTVLQQTLLEPIDLGICYTDC